MKLIKVKNYKEMSNKAFEILSKEILKKPKSVIAFATGKTPLGLYKKLAKSCKKKKINFSDIKAFNLDEYYPINKKDKRSFNYYLFHHFFNKININKQNINLLSGETKNTEKECEDYEKKIKENHIDILILGLGVNGHIAFNEPGTGIHSKTRLVILSEDTIKRNFGTLKGVPKQALTIGIKTILSSKKIILLANGKEKAEALKHLIKGKIGRGWPVSFLKKHKSLIVIADEKAAISV